MTRQHHTLTHFQRRSPLVQMLFGITSLAALGTEGGTLTVWHEPKTEGSALIDGVTSVVRDFFLGDSPA